MSSCDGATIEVKNWEEYNPRTETKRPSWFRFENELATHEKLYGLTCEQKWLWVVILSLLSRRNGKAITWSCGYIQAITGINSETQAQTIEIFEKIFDLRVTRTEARDTRTATCGTRALRDETVRDETERNGTERDGTNLCGGVQKRKPSASGAKAPAATALNREIWEAYREAYLNRHGEEPLRNAQSNSLVAAFGRKVAGHEAADIAAFYVRHNDSLYVRGRHPLELLVRDAQRIRTDWRSGTQMTGGQARGVELKQDIYSVFAPFIAKAEEEEKNGK